MNRIITVLLLCTLNVGYSQTFEANDPTILPSPDITSRMEWVDVDNDHDLDLISFYYNEYYLESSYVKLYQNTDNTYELLPNAFGNNTIAPIAYTFGDYDHDGDLDILIQDQYYIKILINQGNLTFSTLNLGIEIYLQNRRIHWVDIDSDLDIDIILPDYVGNRVFLNNGGTFTEITSSIEDNTYILSWADINNDGLMDFIAIKGAVNPYRTIPYLNTGAGSFEAQTNILSYNVFEYAQAHWFDADADGDVDLFLSESDTKCTVFKNELRESGKPILTRNSQLRDLRSPIAKVGDFDNNGLADILINGELLGNADRQTFLYKNFSTGQTFNFTETNLNIPTQWVYNLNLLDVERDHDLDFFITTTSTTYFGQLRQFYINKSTPTSANTTAPVPLPIVSGDSVVLKWNPSIASGSARYQVQLKRNDQVFNPSNSLNNGDLLMPDLVLPLISTAKLITGLPEGNYEWRVQSINANNVASVFSSYQSFSIEQSPLQLSILQNELTVVHLNWTNSNPLISNIHVYRKSSLTGYKKIASLKPDVNSFLDDNLLPAENYEYYLRADMTGKSFAASNKVTVSTELFEEIPLNNTNTSDIVALQGISADIDNDEDQDLIFEGRLDYHNGSLFYLKNNDNGVSYETVSLGQPTDDQGSPQLFMRDFDNDGDLDFCSLTKESGSGAVSVFENDQGNFNLVFKGAYHRYILQIEISDFNHDGKLDILYSHESGNGTGTHGYQLLIQKSISEFVDSGYAFVPELNKEVGNFILADFNIDGYNDILILPDEVGSSAKLFKNNSGNGFQLINTNLPPISAAFGFDYNQDGFLDLLYGDANYLRVFLGKGDFSFSETDPKELNGLFFQFGYSRMQAVDLDLNGLLDLVVCNTYHCTLLSADKNGTYQQSEITPSSNSQVYKLIVSDIDNDSDFDLIKLSQGVNTILKNQIITNGNKTIQSPSKPVINSVVTIGGQVILTWNPSSDDKTPTELISYNIELINQESGKAMLHPETNSQGDYHRIHSIGNVGIVSSYTFNDLPAGTYKARVQAIDASYKISPFSEAVQFTLTKGPQNFQISRITLLNVKLQWTDDYIDESNFVIQRKSAGSDFETIAVLPANTIEFNNLLPNYNWEYEYRIYAIIENTSTASSDVVLWSTQIFKAEETTLPNVDGTLEVADFNNDGSMEILLRGSKLYTGNTPDYTSAIFEYSDMTWIKQQDVGSNEFPYSPVISAIDINGDHTLDLYHHGNLGGVNGYKTYTYINNHDKSFVSTNTFFSDQQYQLKNTLDFDLDNDMDMYVFKNNIYEPTKEILLKNQGMGNYIITQSNQAICNNECYSTRYALGDFDRDGDEDLFDYDPSSLKYKLYYNENGKLQPSGVAIPSGAAIELHVVDIDADGWLDLFILGNSFDNYYEKSKLFRNMGKDSDGLLQFEKVGGDFPAGDRIDSDWADYDNDGDIDFVISSKFLYLYTNDGKGNFAEYQTPNFHTGIIYLKWIDFDLDGDLDLIFGGYYDKSGLDKSKAIVMKNQIIHDGKGVHNEAPSSPTALIALQEENGLFLTWQPSKDDHTPANSLTYDVILYKDGYQITKAAISQDGIRTKLKSGLSVSSALLNNLLVGEYTWKVQAIDQAYRGSILSVEANFLFRPMAPMINDTTIITCGTLATVKAKGENIEWFSDENLTNRIAIGATYHPESSQIAYVTQTLEGMRSVPNKVNINIAEIPAMPELLAPNSLQFCDEDVAQSITIYVKGENIKWYADAEGKNILKTGNGITTQIGNKTFYTTQTIFTCESDLFELKMEINSINGQINLLGDKVYAAENNATHYEWYFNNAKVPDSNNSFMNYQGEGMYSVYIEKGSCNKMAGPFLITGIDEVTLMNSIEIYPNPTRSEFIIQVNGLTVNATVAVYNIMGRMVYNSLLNSANSSRKIDGSKWEKGLYTISLNYGDRIVYKRVVLN